MTSDFFDDFPHLREAIGCDIPLAPLGPGKPQAEMRPRLAMLAAVTVARAGDRTRAEAMVKEARAAAPRDPELDWLEAAYRVKLGEYEAAERLLRKYVRAYPGPRNRFENGRMFKPLRAWHATARSAN